MKPPEHSRMTILNAAAELLVQMEADGNRAALKVGDVAKRAGVSRTTIYRQFTDREGLLNALQSSHGIDAAGASTRERILAAYGRLLPGRSLKTMTVEEVAAEAGVASVTVYRQFDDKIGLAQAFFLKRGPRHDAAALLVGPPNADPVELLVTFVARLVHFMKAHRSLVLELLSPDEETQTLLSAMRRGDKRTHLAVIEFMTTLIETKQIRASNPEAPALALFSLVLGFAAVFQFPGGGPSSGITATDASSLSPEAADLATAKSIVDVFWNGFGS